MDTNICNEKNVTDKRNQPKEKEAIELLLRTPALLKCGQQIPIGTGRYSKPDLLFRDAQGISIPIEVKNLLRNPCLSDVQEHLVQVNAYLEKLRFGNSRKHFGGLISYSTNMEYLSIYEEYLRRLGIPDNVKVVFVFDSIVWNTDRIAAFSIPRQLELQATTKDTKPGIVFMEGNAIQDTITIPEFSRIIGMPERTIRSRIERYNIGKRYTVQPIHSTRPWRYKRAELELVIQCTQKSRLSNSLPQTNKIRKDKGEQKFQKAIETAKILRDQGLTTQEIATKLTEMRIYTPKGNEFSQPYVSQLLKKYK